MLEDITSKAEMFFEILPQDWQEAIVPCWEDFRESAKVYVIRVDGTICAGGIVFKGMPPDMGHFKEEAQYWLDKGYHYIGFVWVPQDQRNKHYGSLWLSALRNVFPSQKYWLTTEEKALKPFYEKNGFRYVQTLYFGDIVEDLFSSDGPA